MKKLIRYRISIAVKFPATHPRKGERTFFPEMILPSVVLKRQKRHTIRGNYELWATRFEKINRGEAVIELYHWEGKPYNSKQVVFLTLGKDDGIGLQKLEFSASGLFGMIKIDNDFPDTSIASIAKNDGLSLDDFTAWFKGTDLSKSMVIIHFTDFRY